MPEQLAILGGPKAIPDAVQKPWPHITEEDRQAVLRVLQPGGMRSDVRPEIEALEAEWAEYVGVEHCIATNSGTSSLHMSVAAGGIGPGDEVILPAYTFVASATCVLHHNAIPVFVDVEPDTWLLDPAKIEAAITPYTKAILPVHLNGYPTAMDEINAIAEKHNLLVIEDACQAHGCTYKGRQAGTLGDMAGFSLNSFKNLPGQDGGLFVTNDQEFHERAQMVQTFGERIYKGRKREYRSYAMGWMYRTTDLVAAFVRSQLRRLDEMNEVRIRNAEAIRGALEERYDFVSFPPYEPGRTCVYWFFPLKLSAEAAGVNMSDREFRDRMIAALNAEGLRTTCWQTVTLPAQSIFHDKIGYGKGSPWSDRNYKGSVTYDPEQYPVAQMVVDRTIWLVNMYPYPHTVDDQQYTIRAFEKVFSQVHAAAQASS
jgi:dTDP-4-amino-4,6-dideoxygalactose transaminase